MSKEKEKTSTDVGLERFAKLRSERRLGDWITSWTILKAILALVVVILALVFRDQITDYIANWLLSAKGLIQDPSQASLVANYLLAALIGVTILAEFISNLVSWFNRPKVILASIDHGHSGYLRVKEGSQPERKEQVSIVYASLRNNGRDSARLPVVYATILDYKVAGPIGAKTEASWIDKQITVLPANLYPFNGSYDDLAVQFIKRGMKVIDYIHGQGDGKRAILGFAFEHGKHFYFADLESAFINKVTLGSDSRRLNLKFHARNAKGKTLKTNIPASFETWDSVKFDYRRIEGPPRGQPEEEPN